MAPQHQLGRGHERCAAICLASSEASVRTRDAPLSVSADGKLCQVRRRGIKISPHYDILTDSTAFQHVLCVEEVEAENFMGGRCHLLAPTGSCHLPKPS